MKNKFTKGNTMRKLTALMLAALFPAIALASCTPADKDDPGKDILPRTLSLTPSLGTADKDAVVEADTYKSIAEFSSEFAKLSASDDGKNTIVSPMSAYFALAMVKEGAKGTTLSEMSEAMGDISAADMYALISHLTTFEHTTLNIANSIWLNTDFEPQQSYLDTIAKSYLAEGYRTVLADAEKEINAWIEEKTGGLIKDMLSDDALDDALMALVNTIYMDAKWRTPFTHEATHERDFTNADGTLTKTDFMCAFRKEYVIDTDDYIGVSLRYKDESLKFVALMPKDAAISSVDLIDMVARDGGYAALAESAQLKRTNLYMPKFELEYAAILNDIFKAMGMKTAFSNLADFTGVAPDMKISAVLQNAVIKVDEDGTEAAAATVLITEATSAMPTEDPITIEFNRPFAFAVVDTDTGAVLFCGQHNKAE